MADASLPFERIDEYRLVRRLGEGAMGVVYLAIQEPLGREVAIKLLRPGLSLSPTAGTMLRREAHSLAQVQHEGLVEIYGSGEVRGMLYLAMEFVPGHNLAESLREERPDATRVLRWGRDVARALDAAHAAGIVHRDIKPSNLRARPDGRMVVLDFGLARHFESTELTATGQFQGSPAYASPEQVEGDKRAIGPATDVYGLGVTLFECLAGRLPFPSETHAEIFRRILLEDPPLLRELNPEVPRDLETIVQKAMEKKPGARYAGAGELADDLDAVLEFRPIRARRPGPLERLAKWTRRHRATAAGLLTLLLAAIFLSIWIPFQAAHRRSERASRARAHVTRAHSTLADYVRESRTVQQLDLELGRWEELLETRHVSRDELADLRRVERSRRAHGRARGRALAECLEELQTAEQIDPRADGVDDVRAELFLERWRAVDAERDPALAAHRARLVTAHDHEGRWSAVLEAPARLELETEPPGASVHLFKVRRHSEILAGGDPRLVAVSWNKLSEAVDPLPGTWALRVVGVPAEAQAGDAVQVGDLLLEVAGEPIEGPDWLLDRFGGGDLEDLLHTAERGDVMARLYRDGGSRDVLLPRGLALRKTANPLLIGPRSLFGTTPLQEEIEPGSWIAMARLSGHESLRVPFRVEGGESEARQLRLLPVGTSPVGFVRIAPPSSGSLDPFWIQELEVTCESYQRFLNDPETQRQMSAASKSIFVPRPYAPDRSQYPWERTSGGIFTVTDLGFATPKLDSVSWEDAKAYAAWLTAQARNRGEPWRFDLPTVAQWTWAASGPDRRPFVHGYRFRPHWIASKFVWDGRTASVAPPNHFPIDESVFGVFDMQGSLSEWVRDEVVESPERRVIMGSSWWHGRRHSFRLTTRDSARLDVHGIYLGFRLVAWRE